MLVTEEFIRTLQKDGVISSQQKDEMLKQLLATHANTNGFDVEYNKEVKIVAEVKCNIPVKENSFGVAQESSIMDDVKHLFNSKKKSDLSKKAIKDYYKFMVFLEEKNVRDSARKLINKLTDKGSQVEEYSPKTTLQKDTVYFIYISTTRKQ